MSFINTNKIKALLVFVLCAAVLTAMANPAQAQSGLCPSKSPQASVKIATDKTRYIRDRNADSLTDHHNTGDGITLGLAGGPIEIAIQSSFSITTRGSSSCVKLEKLSVLMKAKPEIHIASNFKPGSCEYREVLNHEKKHIRTLRNFIREYSPKLTREVRQIVRTSETQKIVSERHVKGAQDRIQRAVVDRINVYQEKIMDILRYRQTQIDSLEEYERVTKACKGWNRKLAQEKRTRS